MTRSTRARAAEIVREYGPFPGLDHVHGVTYDGQHVWFAAGDTLNLRIQQESHNRSFDVITDLCCGVPTYT